MAVPACTDVGGTCGLDEQCCSGHCDNQTCVACGESSDLCTSGSDCCSGTCTNNECTFCEPLTGDCTSDSDCCVGLLCVNEECDVPGCATNTCAAWLAGTVSYAKLCGVAKSWADQWVACSCQVASDACPATTCDQTACASELDAHSESQACDACVAENPCDGEASFCRMH